MSTTASEMGSVITKLYVIAVSGIDPAQLVMSICKDVIQKVFGGIVNLIKANQEYANPPSPTMFGSNFYVFYQNGSAGQLMYGLWNGTTWTQNNVVPGVTMTAGPGAVSFNNLLYVFYQESSGQLAYITSSDGTTWSATQQVSGASLSDSPCAVVFNGRLYVFFRKSNSSVIGYVSSADGESWGATQQVPNLDLSCSPSAVVFDNQIYLFHQGDSDNGQLWYDRSSDGQSWSGDTCVSNVGLVGSPSAVAYEGQIYVFHSGNAKNVGELWFTTYDGSSWAQDIQVAPQMLSESPAAVVFTPPGGAPAIYYFYQGPGALGVLWCNVFNGARWTSINPIQQATIMSCSPGPVVFNNTLYCFYEGPGNNGKLMYSSSTDGQTWSGQSQVTGVSIWNAPSPVVFEGRLYIFYSISNALQHVSSSDGVNWSAVTTVPGVGIYYAPSAVVFNGELYVFHGGMEAANDTKLWYTTSSDGVHWSSDNNPICNGYPIGISNSPNAVVFNNAIHILAQSANNGGILQSWIFNGSSWSQDAMPGPDWESFSMSNSPGGVVFDGQLYVAYQGGASYTWQAGNGRLGYCVCNGDSWTVYPPPPQSTNGNSFSGTIVSLTQDEWDAVNAAGEFIP